MWQPAAGGDPRIDALWSRVQQLERALNGATKLVMQLADDLYTYHREEVGDKPRKEA